MDFVDFVTQNLADIAVLALFAVFAAGFGRRGLYKSLAGVIVAVAAVLGALLLTHLLSGAVTDWVWPRVEERFGAKVDLSGVTAVSLDGLTAQLEQLLPEGFLNLARKLGLEVGAFVSGVLGASGVAASAERAASEAVDALLYSVTGTAVKLLLFFVLLIVLRLLLRGVKRALGLAFRLPVVHGIDALGGAVLGVAVCGLVLYVGLWLCDLFRVEAVLDLAAQSRILTAFLGA